MKAFYSALAFVGLIAASVAEGRQVPQQELYQQLTEHYLDESDIGDNKLDAGQIAAIAAAIIKQS